MNQPSWQEEGTHRPAHLYSAKAQEAAGGLSESDVPAPWCQNFRLSFLPLGWTDTSPPGSPESTRFRKGRPDQDSMLQGTFGEGYRTFFRTFSKQ